MDEELLNRLVEQVKILAETVQLQTDRQEQLFKTQLETQQASIQRDADLRQTMDSLQITDQALKDALSDVDRITDDLTTTVAALLQFQKGQQSEQSATS